VLAKKVLKNVAYSTFSILVSNVAGILITIYVARVLKPNLFGIYSLAISVAFLFLTFTDLGVNATATRFIAHANDDFRMARSFFRLLAKIKLALSSLTALTIFFASGVLSNYVFHKPELSLPLKVMALFVFFYSISGFLNSVANAFHDFRSNLVRTVSYETSRGLSIYFLTAQFLVLGALFGFVIAALVSLLAMSVLIFRKYSFLIFGEVENVELRRVFRFTFYLTIGSITWIFFAYVDTVMIGMFLPAEFVGFYRAAYTIVGAISGLISVAAVVFPVFVQLEGKDLQRAFSRAFKYTSVLVFPAVFGLILLSDRLVTFVYGREYLISAPVLNVLSFLILNRIFVLYNQVFSAKEMPEYPVYVTVFATLTNVVLNYFLILSLGIMGAALATLISNAISWIALTFLSSKKLGVSSSFDHVAKPLVAASLMFAVMRNFEPNSVAEGLLFVLFAAAIYFATLFAIKGLTREDVNYIKKILKSFSETG